MKRAAEKLLDCIGIPALGRRLRRGQSVVLCYHNVLPTPRSGGGDRSLHLPRETFATQLDVIRRTHEVVSLEECFESPAGGRRRPRAAITFDDAYRGAVTVGVEELVKRGMPATIFVPGAHLDCGTYWWDEIYWDAIDEREDVREDALVRCCGEGATVRKWIRENDFPRFEPGSPARVADEEEILEAGNAPGMTVGSHGWTHLNLSAIGEDRVRRELARSLAWLDALGARTTRVLAYPYGRASDGVASVAKEVGFTAAFLVAGGWIPSAVEDPFWLPRVNVPASLSEVGFALRLAGIVS